MSGVPSIALSVGARVTAPTFFFAGLPRLRFGAVGAVVDNPSERCISFAAVLIGADQATTVVQVFAALAGITFFFGRPRPRFFDGETWTQLIFAASSCVALCGGRPRPRL